MLVSDFASWHTPFFKLSFLFFSPSLYECCILSLSGKVGHNLNMRLYQSSLGTGLVGSELNFSCQHSHVDWTQDFNYDFKDPSIAHEFARYLQHGHFTLLIQFILDEFVI